MIAKRIPMSDAWTGVADCRNCSIRQSVLFAGLSEDDFESIHSPVDQFTYPEGALIYRVGETASSMFTIRRGLVKLARYLPDGTQRIVRLSRTTDVLGLEGIVGQSYQHDAIALQVTEVCRLPVADVRALSERSSALFNELMARWHRAVSDADICVTEFSTGNARQRVARLMLRLVEDEANARAQLFGREDVGAVLGITTETASRTIAEFKRQGLLAEYASNRFVCDVPNLRRIAEG